MKIKKAPRRELSMPRGGLEPPCLSALVPETSVSANSTIWAFVDPSVYSKAALIVKLSYFETFDCGYQFFYIALVFNAYVHDFLYGAVDLCRAFVHVFYGGS